MADIPFEPGGQVILLDYWLATGFVAYPHLLLDYACKLDLYPIDQVIVLVLLSYVTRQKKVAFPSYQTIMDRCNVKDNRTVKDSMRRMAEKGYLEVGMSDDGRRIYDITPLMKKVIELAEADGRADFRSFTTKAVVAGPEHKKSENPRHQAIDYYYTQFKLVFDAPAQEDWPRDMKHMNRILKDSATKTEVAWVKASIYQYLRLDDPEVKKRGYTLSTLCYHAQTYQRCLYLAKEHAVKSRQAKDSGEAYDYTKYRSEFEKEMEGKPQRYIAEIGFFIRWLQEKHSLTLESGKIVKLNNGERA